MWCEGSVCLCLCDECGLGSPPALTQLPVNSTANVGWSGYDAELARFINGSSHPVPSYWQQFEYYFTVAYAAPSLEGRVKAWMNFHFQVSAGNSVPLPISV